MPIIASLLRRAQANAAGVYVDRPWENAPDADRSPLEQCWHAWKEAHVALEDDDLPAASGWLRAAEERLAAHDDPLCRVEVETTWMRLADRLEEPREAAGYATTAWNHWFALASSPSASDAVPSVRALLSALAPDEDTMSIDDGRLFVEWMSDRLGPSLQYVFRTIIRLYGRLGLIDEALAVAGEMRSFFDRYLAHVPANVRGVSYADLQESVGNLHDQAGNLEASYDAFAEGVALLDDAPDHPEVHQLRARLSFNAANELSKMGRFGDATPHYERALKAFVQLDATEPILRARHALLVNRFKAGADDHAELRRELEALTVEYESLDDDAGGAVRQNLDSAYRLWLTLAAPDTQDDAKLTHRFLGQLNALREGLGTFARDWAAGPERATSEVILSEVAVLGARLGRLERSVLLVLESGVDSVVLTTIRSGDEPLAARARSAVGDDTLGSALEALVQGYRDATEDLIQRTLPVKSEPSEELMAACQAVWDALPETIRDEVAQADTVFVMPSNAGNMDEVPVELIHDGTAFLGTRAAVVRVSSLKQLTASLGENRVNVASYATSVVVQAGDVDALGALPNAGAEAEAVSKALDAPDRTVWMLADTTLETLTETLASGADVLHFVGHGMADENGEMLVLGAGEAQRARAIDLRGMGPAPAPVCIMSSCELGRSRHLQSGEQQGVVVALLEAGAPAVVAATYSVPDVVGRQFAQALYRRAGDTALGEAVRGARRALAKSGVHPAAWGSFVMFGEPAAPMIRAPRDVDAIGWPACLVRFAATGAPQYAGAVRSRLRDDARLTPEQRRHVGASIDAFEQGDAAAFATDAIRSNPLLQLDAESYLSYHVLLCAGALRFALRGSTEDERRPLLSFLLQVRPMLEDSYLRALIARECAEDLELILTTDQGRAILRSGLRALGWLAADDDALQETRQTLHEIEQASERAVAFNAQEMTGVDSETYQSADEGDRQAQKRLVRELFTRRASLAAVSSAEPWTTWMLRMIASGTEQSICDLFGVIDESRKARRLSPQEADALDELIEQFIGPGEVRHETAELVTETFSSMPLEREVIALFLAHDRLASGAPDVTANEIGESVQRAEAIGSEAALTFFLGVWAQYAAQAGQLEHAVPAAQAALTLAAKLAESDEEMQDRVGRTALLLSQLYEHSGEPALAAAVQVEHYEAVRAHLDRAEGVNPERETPVDESSEVADRPPSGEMPGPAVGARPPRSPAPPAG